MGWIILGLIAVVIAGLVAVGARRRRVLRERLASQSADAWTTARGAATATAAAQADTVSRARPVDWNGGAGLG